MFTSHENQSLRAFKPIEDALVVRNSHHQKRKGKQPKQSCYCPSDGQELSPFTIKVKTNIHFTEA
jgi:hypothetical protein